MELCQIRTEQCYDVEMIDTSSKPCNEYLHDVSYVNNQFGYVTVRFNTTFQGTGGQFYSFVDTQPMPNMMPSTFPQVLTGSIYNAWSVTTLSQSSRCTAKLFIDMLNGAGGKLVSWSFPTGIGVYPDMTAFAPGGGLGYFPSMFALCVAAPNTTINQVFTSLALTGVTGWNFNIDMSFIPITEIKGVTSLGIQIQSAVIAGAKPFRLAMFAEFGGFQSPQIMGGITLTTMPGMIVDNPTYLHNPNWTALQVEVQTSGTWAATAASANTSPAQIFATALAKQIVGLQVRSNQFTYTDANATIILYYIATHTAELIPYVHPLENYYTINIIPTATVLQVSSLTSRMQVLGTIGGIQTNLGLAKLDTLLTGSTYLSYVLDSTLGNRWDSALFIPSTFFKVQMLKLVDSTHAIGSEFPNQFDITPQVMLAVSLATYSGNYSMPMTLSNGVYSVSFKIEIVFGNGGIAQTTYFIEEDEAVEETANILHPNRLLTYRKKLASPTQAEVDAMLEIVDRIKQNEKQLNEDPDYLGDPFGYLGNLDPDQAQSADYMERQFRTAYAAFITGGKRPPDSATMVDLENLQRVARQAGILKDESILNARGNQLLTLQDYKLLDNKLGKTVDYVGDKLFERAGKASTQLLKDFTTVSDQGKGATMGMFTEIFWTTVIEHGADSPEAKAKLDLISKSGSKGKNLAKYLGAGLAQGYLDSLMPEGITLTTVKSHVANGISNAWLYAKDYMSGTGPGITPPVTVIIDNKKTPEDHLDKVTELTYDDTQNIKDMTDDQYYDLENPAYKDVNTFFGNDGDDELSRAKQAAWVYKYTGFRGSRYQPNLIEEYTKVIDSQIQKGVITAQAAVSDTLADQYALALQNAYSPQDKAMAKISWLNNALNIVSEELGNGIQGIQTLEGVLATVGFTIDMFKMLNKDGYLDPDLLDRQRTRAGNAMKYIKSRIKGEVISDLVPYKGSYQEETYEQSKHDPRPPASSNVTPITPSSTTPTVPLPIEYTKEEVILHKTLETITDNEVLIEKDLETARAKKDFVKISTLSNTKAKLSKLRSRTYAKLASVTASRYQRTGASGGATVAIPSGISPEEAERLNALNAGPIITYNDVVGTLRHNTNDSIFLMPDPSKISANRYMQTYLKLVMVLFEEHKNMLPFVVNPNLTATWDGRMATSESFKEMAMKLMQKYGNVTALQTTILTKSIATYFRLAIKVCQLNANPHGVVQFKVYASLLDPKNHSEHQINEQVQKFLHKKSVYDAKRTLNKQAGKKLDMFQSFVDHADKTQDFIERLVIHLPQEHSTNISKIGMYITGRSRNNYSTGSSIMKIRESKHQIAANTRQRKALKSRPIPTPNPERLQTSLRSRTKNNEINDDLMFDYQRRKIN